MNLKKKNVVKREVREKKTHERTALKPVVKKVKKTADKPVVTPNKEVETEKPVVKKQQRKPQKPVPVEPVVVSFPNNPENNEQNI